MYTYIHIYTYIYIYIYIGYHKQTWQGFSKHVWIGIGTFATLACMGAGMVCLEWWSYEILGVVGRSAHCNTLNTLSHAHCNMLRHTATHCNPRMLVVCDFARCWQICKLQHAVAHCNMCTPCNTYTHCNTL